MHHFAVYLEQNMLWKKGGWFVCSNFIIMILLMDFNWNTRIIILFLCLWIPEIVINTTKRS